VHSVIDGPVESAQTMRAYLLGTLPEPLAAAVEERYFVDRTFYSECEAYEAQLIGEYLDGQLRGADLERFQARYLQIPELVNTLERVRKARARTGASRHIWRAQAVAATIMVCLLGSTAWLFIVHSRKTNLATNRTATTAALVFHISPGVSKQGNANPVQVRNSTHPIRLVLEVPGRTAPFATALQISSVDIDGRWRKVWAPAIVVHSVSSASGQEVTVEIPPGILTRGDYVVEISEPGGNPIHTYVFRVLGTG
jgi:hypothetical protein